VASAIRNYADLSSVRRGCHPSATRQWCNDSTEQRITNIDCWEILRRRVQAVLLSSFLGRANTTGEIDRLILRRPLDAIDNNHLDGPLGRDEFQSELFFQGSESRRSRIGRFLLIVRGPSEFEVIVVGEAGSSMT